MPLPNHNEQAAKGIAPDYPKAMPIPIRDLRLTLING